MKKIAIVTAIATMVCCGTTTITANNFEMQQSSEKINCVINDPTPPFIAKFLSTYFPKANIYMLHPDMEKFEIRLTDNTEIDFNRNGEWKRINCKNSSVYCSVPSEIIPQQIAAYVNGKYADQHIVKIEKKRNNWEVKLNNELEIKFDKDFNVTKINS
ncbi:PepSY-like domain-containing protein [Bacteroides heparinolyticus]|uniref:PepSY-like domain-containing protein n=1 Tax=Prevotella heparinolytica TaxID=28113 RepID=UPI00359FF005